MLTEPASQQGRRCRVRPWLPAACLLLASLHQAAAQTAQGEPDTAYTMEQIAFIAADTDGANRISLPELARDAAHGFATLDKDGSGTLTPAELGLGPHDQALFERIDLNKDGKLSFQEVMINKERAFKQGDTNHDGYLSFEEMTAIVEIELGKTP